MASRGFLKLIYEAEFSFTETIGRLETLWVCTVQYVSITCLWTFDEQIDNIIWTAGYEITPSKKYLVCFSLMSEVNDSGKSINRHELLKLFVHRELRILVS